MANLWLLAIVTAKPVQPQDKYILRLPDGMRDQIAVAAKANGRSMNAEMVARLKQSFEVEEERLDMMRLASGLIANTTPKGLSKEQHPEDSGPSMQVTPKTKTGQFLAKLIERHTEKAIKTVLKQMEKDSPSPEGKKKPAKRK